VVHRTDTFNRAVSNALASGVLVDAETDEARYRLIVNYLNAFDAELFDKKLLIRSAYFEAIFDVLDEAVRSSVTQFKNAKQESLQKVIRPLAKLDYSAATGGALPTKKSIVGSMQAVLRQDVTLSEDML
jgi:DNA sulfur modification protein DndB